MSSNTTRGDTSKPIIKRDVKKGSPTVYSHRTYARYAPGRSCHYCIGSYSSKGVPQDKLRIAAKTSRDPWNDQILQVAPTIEYGRGLFQDQCTFGTGLDT